jgi:hypothetical protein
MEYAGTPLRRAQVLARTGSVAAEARSLTERVRALPQLMPVGRISDEPNGR